MKDTIKFENKGNVQMIAHRGVSGLERENTCAAFVLAGVKSFYGIETDVHITADGKVIVYHDDNVKRLTGLDMVIEETTFDELRKLRFTDGGSETRRGSGIMRNDLCLPSLEEYISICRKYDKQSILELKNVMQKEKVWEIVETIKEMGWYERTTFISFQAENLLALREKYEDSDAQFLRGAPTEEHYQFMIDNRLDADLKWNVITEEVIDRLHKAGRKVNCWVVNDAKISEDLKNMGIDQITSDIVE